MVGLTISRLNRHATSFRKSASGLSKYKCRLACCQGLCDSLRYEWNLPVIPVTEPYRLLEAKTVSYSFVLGVGTEAIQTLATEEKSCVTTATLTHKFHLVYCNIFLYSIYFVFYIINCYILSLDPIGKYRALHISFRPY